MSLSHLVNVWSQLANAPTEEAAEALIARLENPFLRQAVRKEWARQYAETVVRIGASDD